MSGPKKSEYQLRMERIREERARKRQQQKQEILNRLSHVEQIANRLGDNKIYSWINDIKNSLNGDLRDVFRSLKRLESFAKNQEIVFNDIKAYERAQAQAKLKAKQEKALKEEKVKYLLDSLENMTKDYEEIVNDAVLQRIEMFKKSLTLNPDNQNTLNQVEQFKNQLSQMYENYLDKKEATEYVANSFRDILGGNVKQNGENYSIEGQINGVNIKVKLNTKTNEINFDTPHTSQCTSAMEEIVDKLSSKDIKLGAIKVLKTGQMLNSTQNRNQQRIRQ